MGNAGECQASLQFKLSSVYSLLFIPSQVVVFPEVFDTENFNYRVGNKGPYFSRYLAVSWYHHEIGASYETEAL